MCVYCCAIVFVVACWLSCVVYGFVEVFQNVSMVEFIVFGCLLLVAKCCLWFVELCLRVSIVVLLLVLLLSSGCLLVLNWFYVFYCCAIAVAVDMMLVCMRCPWFVSLRIRVSMVFLLFFMCVLCCVCLLLCVYIVVLL